MCWTNKERTSIKPSEWLGGVKLRYAILLVVLLVRFSAHAQNAPTSAGAGAGSGGLRAFGEKVVAIFGKPLHPIVESVAPGGGFGPGIGYRTR